MPPRASHRVDLVLVPRTPEVLPDAAAFARLRARWAAEGRLSPGTTAPLVVGGARDLRLDLPGRVALYANQQGGYRVQCPQTGGYLTRAFSAAVEAWRAGKARVLACPACGGAHALEAVILQPPGAFAQGGVVFSDVGSLELAPGVRAELEVVLGEGSREVVRRVG